jgi:hypothetical protein
MSRFFAVFCVLAVLCVGCGTEESPIASEKRIHQSSCLKAPTESAHPAVQTVSDFMTAMLRGEDEKIRSLLTPKARKVGEEQGVPFSPPASDTATFTVDKVEPNGSSISSVTTTLTDIDPESGQKESSEIVWTVVETEEGWRVSGAQVALFEGQPKILIDFENPEAAQKALMDAEAKEKQRQTQ